MFAADPTDPSPRRARSGHCESCLSSAGMCDAARWLRDEDCCSQCTHSHPPGADDAAA